MAIVSPLLTPVTGPATKEPPLMEMPVQPVPQVAVRLENPPASVTVLLVMVVLTLTLVWLVKLKAELPAAVPPIASGVHTCAPT